MSTIDERINEFFRHMVSGRKCIVDAMISSRQDGETHKSVVALKDAFEAFLDACDSWEYNVDEAPVLTAKMFVAKGGVFSSPDAWVGGEAPTLGKSAIIVVPPGVTVTAEEPKPEPEPEPETEPTPQTASVDLTLTVPTPTPTMPAVAVPTPPAPEPMLAIPEPTPTPPSPAPPPVPPPAPEVPAPTPAPAPTPVAVVEPPKESPPRQKSAAKKPRKPKKWVRKKIPIGVIASNVVQRRRARKQRK